MKKVKSFKSLKNFQLSKENHILMNVDINSEKSYLLYRGKIILLR